MLRLLHTADWHLGHQLHGVDRDNEHGHFLDWLLDTLEARAVDVLIIAGDIFDSANPPATAQARCYDFLARARQRCPTLEVVIIAGNHDSPGRLAAPAPLLASLGARVVGLLPRGSDRVLDTASLLVPLHDAAGQVAAWCAAVPFLRPADLPTVSDLAVDPLVEGVRQVYQEVYAAAEACRRPDQALIATGHCYLARAQLSELSERKVLRGNQHALPADIFPEQVTYAALGHLHLAQAIGRETVRYSGSPIPLALDERHYRHQVQLVTLAGAEVQDLQAIPIPRYRDIVSLPTGDPVPLAELLAILERQTWEGLPQERWPLLECRLLLERPEPGLRVSIEDALQGCPVRLVRIGVHYRGSGEALADGASGEDLERLDPETVFRRRYARDYDDEPAMELLSAFHELLDQVHDEE